MLEAHVSERKAFSPTLLFLDGLPIAPALLSFGVAVLASGVLLLVEFGSGRLEWLAANSADGLRNLRLSFGFIAMVAYLPPATFYALRGARRTADELRPLLGLDDANVRAQVDAIRDPARRCISEGGGPRSLGGADDPAARGSPTRRVSLCAGPAFGSPLASPRDALRRLVVRATHLRGGIA